MNKLTTLVFVAGLGTLSLTACGGGDESGSAAGFCDSIQRLEDSGVEPDSDFDGAIKALQDVKSNAPSELEGELDTFIGVMNKINDAGEDAEFTDFEDDFEKMTTSIEKIQEYADDNCDDLPENIFD